VSVEDTPVARGIVAREIARSGLGAVGLAGIREIRRLVDRIEAAAGLAFIRMEMGVPGLPPSPLAVAGESASLAEGVGAVYPPFDGLPGLKEAISHFIRLFTNITIPPACCWPTVGAMQGCLLGMLTAARCRTGRNRIVFIDPGFPVNKLQTRVLGLPSARFDIYDFRGPRLAAQLEHNLAAGDVAAVLYSNPNNPSWICLTEEELEIIGRLCTRYEAIALEDLAYFGMDFRRDYSVPGKPPYVPSVARYTDRCVLIISCSKAFSLAGQRIAMAAVPEALFGARFPDLEPFFGSDRFGYALTYGGLYTQTAGVSHSAQRGLQHLLEAINAGRYNFLEPVREYGRRAAAMKRIFQANGFHLVYDRDGEEPLADGFYFTVAYPGLSGHELVEALLTYGISAIALATTGSSRSEGIRACVSQVPQERLPELQTRLECFQRHHPATRTMPLG
jgi:aspartate/methionine/tyrosine aminotransferase